MRCLRLLQKNKPANTSNATPAIGTTTATAILPDWSRLLDGPPPPEINVGVLDVEAPVVVPELGVANEVTVSVFVDRVSEEVDVGGSVVELVVVGGVDEPDVSDEEGSLLVEVGVGVEELLDVVDEGVGVVEEDDVGVGDGDVVVLVGGGGGGGEEEEEVVVEGSSVDEAEGVSLVDVTAGSCDADVGGSGIDELVGLADMVN